MSPKEGKLHMRIDEKLEVQIDEMVELFKEKMGIKVTKTTIIESALEEGLKVLKAKLDTKE